MNKPIIIFFEPFEIIVEENSKSFFTNDIRDKYGKPEKFESNDDINKFLLDYINI
jgi:hypothetical protein